MGLFHLAGSAVLFVVCGIGGFLLSSQPSTPVRVYSAAQAEAGRGTYRDRCAICHAGDLGGRDDAPALAGESFMSAWGTRTTADLYQFLRVSMPPDGTQLTTEEYLALVAYMLDENGAEAGPAPLTETTAAAIGLVATGRRPGIAAPAGLMARAGDPVAARTGARRP